MDFIFLYTIHDPRELYYNHHVNIIVIEKYFQPSMIYLMAGETNRSLVAGHWVAVQVNNNIQAYAAQVNISEGMTKIFHTNAAAQMMAIVYGFAPYEAYGHAGGFRIPKGCYELLIQHFLKQKLRQCLSSS